MSGRMGASAAGAVVDYRMVEEYLTIIQQLFYFDQVSTRYSHNYHTTNLPYVVVLYAAACVNVRACLRMRGWTCVCMCMDVGSVQRGAGA